MPLSLIESCHTEGRRWRSRHKAVLAQRIAVARAIAAARDVMPVGKSRPVGVTLGTIRCGLRRRRDVCKGGEGTFLGNALH
jgi:hypothetical protein